MLLKIPLVLVQIVGIHISLTPPNRASPKEQVTPQRLESCFNAFVVYGGMRSVNAVFCLAGLAEIAVLLAKQYPAHPISSVVLENLLFPGSRMFNTNGLTLAAVIGCILVTAGGLLRRWCYRTLDRLFTFELSIRSGHKLVTTGPYAFVRHPSYSGALMVYVGSLLTLFGPGGWTRDSGVLSTVAGGVVFTTWFAVTTFIGVVALFQRTETEDRMMRESFGKEWESWAERVRWKVIPGVM